MHPKTITVTSKVHQNWVHVINESDFDENLHELYVEEAQKADPKDEREALKAKATELGLEFAQNISTDKLAKLVEEAQKAE